ncbi:MAG: polysulfide reductase NrfD [Archaeoglobaceae archaeon]|nr:polysulfide reductase NrfD [Archaeoglobaceae archaeon]
MLILNPQHYYLIEQPWWEILIALYLFLGGLGSMVYAVSFYYWRKGITQKMVVRGSIAGILAVSVGILMLVLDLGHPERFYLVLLSPRLNFGSWIFIGSSVLSAFMLFAILFVAPMLKWFKWLPWAENKKAIKFFGWVAFLFAICVAAYTGILIGIVYNVPFWNAPALPVIFMISALSTGLATLVLLLAPIREEGVEKITRTLAKSDGFVMLVELIVLGLYLIIRSYGPVGAIEAIHLILKGWLAPYFVGGVLLTGLAIPLLLIFGYEIRAKEEKVRYVAMLSAILVLVGGAMLRYVVLEAGVLQIPCCP